jgi:hypothetical protein
MASAVANASMNRTFEAADGVKIVLVAGQTSLSFMKVLFEPYGRDIFVPVVPFIGFALPDEDSRVAYCVSFFTAVPSRETQ